MSRETCDECGRAMPRGEPAFLADARSRVVCRECYDQLHPACPHCGHRCSARIKGKARCDACGREFFVRPTAKVFGSPILTAEQAAELQQVSWSDLKTLGDPERVYQKRRLEIRQSTGQEPTLAQVLHSLRSDILCRRAANGCLRHLRRFGIDHRTFARHWKKLESRNGGDPDPVAVKYDVWAELLSRQRVSARVYLNLARDLHADGRDAVWAQRKALQIQVQRLAHAGVRAVRIVPREDACEACRAQAGRILTIEACLERSPLPCEQCTHARGHRAHGWCRCSYAPA